MIQHAVSSARPFEEAARRWGPARASCPSVEPTALSASLANRQRASESGRDAFSPVDADEAGVAVRRVTGTMEVIIAAIVAIEWT
jgi:hypothetical protein